MKDYILITYYWFSDVNVELVPAVVKFSRNRPENRLEVVERQLKVPEWRSGPFRLNLPTTSAQIAIV